MSDSAWLSRFVSDNFGVDESILPSERATIAPYIYEVAAFYHEMRLRSPYRVNWRFVQSTRYSSVFGERLSVMEEDCERWIIIDLAGVEFAGVLLGALACWDGDDANVLARWILAEYLQRLMPSRFESRKVSADFADRELQSFAFPADISRDIRQGASELRDEFKKSVCGRYPMLHNTGSSEFFDYIFRAAFSMSIHVVLGHEVGHHIYNTSQNSPMIEVVNDFSRKLANKRGLSANLTEEIFCDAIAVENCFYQAQRVGMPMCVPTYIVAAWDTINMLVGIQNASGHITKKTGRREVSVDYLFEQADKIKDINIQAMLVKVSGVVVLCDGFLLAMTLSARKLAEKLL